MINADDSRSTKTSSHNEEAFANLVAKLFDFWSTAFSNMSESPLDAFRASVLNALGSGEGGDKEPSIDPLSASDAIRAFAGFTVFSRIQLVAVLSALRYGSNLAQAFGDHQSSFLRLMSAQSPGTLREEERRQILEDLRSWLREIGELSSQEARIFQSELQKIGDDLVNVADVPTTPDNYRRRWKCKM
jgi:hypothetical protein